MWRLIICMNRLKTPTFHFQNLTISIGNIFRVLAVSWKCKLQEIFDVGGRCLSATKSREFINQATKRKGCGREQWNIDRIDKQERNAWQLQYDDKSASSWHLRREGFTNYFADLWLTTHNRQHRDPNKALHRCKADPYWGPNLLQNWVSCDASLLNRVSCA